MFPTLSKAILNSPKEEPMDEDKFMSMAEREMQKSLKEGKLDNLKLKGKPINLRPDIWTPEDLRVQYKIYKNAGILPPEVKAKVDIENWKEELKSNNSLTEEERSALRKKIQLADVQLNIKLDHLKKSI